MAGMSFTPIYEYLEGAQRERIIERFWSLVDRCAPDECWRWQGARKDGGYGSFKIASYRTAPANRVAWAIANGREPGELLVRHRCDNPPCCNPSHLLIGTHADNMRDKVERGRCVGRPMNGENNAHAILTAAQVGEIVEGFRRGELNTRIAMRFPVGHSIISRIRTGRSWQTEAARFGWPPAMAAIERTGLAPTPDLCSAIAVAGTRDEEDRAFACGETLEQGKNLGQSADPLRTQGSAVWA